MSNSMHPNLRGRPARAACAAALGLLLAGCSTTNRAPTDTGSMAMPQPMAPGILTTTGPGTATQPRDTGNMAYPAPMPQGNIGTTRVR